MSQQKFGFITQTATVMEMTSDGVDAIEVPIESGLVQKLAEGDENPMFVTIEVINEGVSRNGRAYDKDTLYSLAEQINLKKPDGYYGHLTDEERKTKFPEPQTIWIGAKVAEVGGKLRLFAKGYVLPEAKGLRSYLKKAKAASKNVAVSVYGLAQVVKDAVRKDVMLVKSMTLESIDWARPGSEGVRNMGLFSVTSEMTDTDSNKTTEGETMDRTEVLQSVTVDELKETNPAVVTEMVSEAVSEKAAEFDTIVSEMAEVRTTLGLNEDQSTVETVKEMTERLQGYELDEQLASKVESMTARKIIKQLVVSEMQSGIGIADAVNKVLDSETGKSVVKEMLDAAPRVMPMTQQVSMPVRKFTKKG